MSLSKKVSFKRDTRYRDHLGLLKPAGYPAVIGGACDGVPVTGMSQSVDIDANGVPVIIQAEALGQEDHSGPGQVGYFNLDCHSPGPGREADRFAVGKTQFSGVRGVDRQAARPSKIPCQRGGDPYPFS